MSWKAVATLIITVATLILIGAYLGPVLTEVVYAIAESGNYNGEYMKESMATGLISTWFNTILLSIFGLIFVSIAYVVKNELTRGQL